MKETKLGLDTTLTIIFVVLKVLGIITWSWVWVFSPIWLSFVLLIGLAGLRNFLVALEEKLYG